MSNITPSRQIDQIHILRDAGRSKRSVALELNLDYSTVRTWWNKNAPVFQLAEKSDLKSLQCGFESHSGYHETYCYTLGLYFGNGYINLQNSKYNVYRLRIEQNIKYPTLICQHLNALNVLFPNNTAFTVRNSAGGSVSVNVYGKDMLLFFPHEGVGYKHLRPIVLTDWQQQLVLNNPKPFIRGLLQTDGCRFNRRVNGKDYICYSFTNCSFDIMQLFCWACGLVGISPTLHNRPSLSPADGHPTGATKHTATIAKRETVALLDEFVGPKT